ncbi:hypothetical protein KOW79_021141 [Hemibagrus wyckioides]|uniref:Uncharacterized protein n=1 Tax=Hemibagrus wyckioides TaxID=337641 RepID=A0A9D3N2B0_9TELE|nr:hypothetical protein KOW79_021141 [Hemibagrus wyckioides]
MVAPLTRHRYMLMGSSPSRPPDGNLRGSEKPFDKWAIHCGSIRRHLLPWLISEKRITEKLKQKTGIGDQRRGTGLETQI